MDNNSTALCAISDKLFENKRSWDQYCQEVADNFYPMRADFTRTLNLGEGFATGTMEGTPFNNRETLGNTIDSLLRQGEWFDVTTGDPARDRIQENAEALAYGTRTLRAISRDRRANFDRATKEADMDWVTFGQPTLSVEYVRAAGHLVVRPWHPRDIATMQNTSGATDTVHRKADETARDMVKKFKEGRWTGTLHPEVKRIAATDPLTTFRVRHVLMPADEVYGSDGPKMRKLNGAKHLSIYIDLDHDCILHEAPARVFNYVVPRWRTLGTRPNGFSPIIANILPDARMLQQMALVILEAGQKAVDPPIIIANDLFARGGSLNLYAGGGTYVDLGEGGRLQDMMTTVEPGRGLEAGMALKQDVRALLADGFLLNKLFLPSLHEMTAQESNLRTEEFRRAALPFFTPIQSEYHEPLLSVMWDMAVLMRMVDANRFPPDLHNRDMVFQFSSPLEAADGQKRVASYQQSVQVIATGAQVDATVAQIFDMHEATLDAVRGTGAPPEWILSGDKLKEAQAKAEEDKALAEAAQKTAAAASITNAMAGASMAGQQAGLLQPPGGGGMPAGPGA